MKPVHIDKRVGSLGRIFSSIPSKLLGVPVAASILLGYSSFDPFVRFAVFQIKQLNQDSSSVDIFLRSNHMIFIGSISLSTFTLIWVLTVFNFIFYRNMIPILSSGRNHGPSITYFVVRYSSGALYIGIGFSVCSIVLKNIDEVISVGNKFGVTLDYMVMTMLVVVSFINRRFTKIGISGIEELIGQSLSRRLLLLLGYIVYAVLVLYALTLVIRFLG